MYPQANAGVGPLSLDEMDMLQSQTDLHAKLLLDTSLRYGKTATYQIPQSELDGEGPYEVNFPSMDAGKIKICQINILLLKVFFFRMA